MAEPSPPTIDEQAATWTARRLSGAMTIAEQHKLDIWLAEDPRHEQAYFDYSTVVDTVDQAQIELMEHELDRDLEEFAQKKVPKTSWLIGVPAIAASLAGVGLFFSGILQNAPNIEQFSTLHGETATYTLSDGSTVALNTDSAIQVHYSPRGRNVTLSKGEVLFNVVRDAERPFRVSSNTAETVVLGTQFNVYDSGNNTTISVISGVVQVDSPKRNKLPDTASVTLSAGQEISYNQSGSHEAIRSFDSENVSSWQNGTAYYEHEALSTVINDLNRYYSIKLSVRDSQTGSIPVSGRFDLKNSDVTIEALKAALSLRTDNTTPGTVIFIPNE